MRVIRSFVRSSIYYSFFYLTIDYSFLFLTVRSFVRPYILILFLPNRWLSPFGSYPFVRSLVRTYITHLFYLTSKYHASRLNLLSRTFVHILLIFFSLTRNYHASCLMRSFVRTFVHTFLIFFLFNNRLSPFASYPIFRSFVRPYMTHVFVFFNHRVSAFAAEVIPGLSGRVISIPPPKKNLFLGGGYVFLS